MKGGFVYKINVQGFKLVFGSLQQKENYFIFIIINRKLNIVINK